MIVAICSTTGASTAAAPVGTNGTVTGTQTNTSGGLAVAGGTVQLLSGSTVVTTATPNGSGVYSMTSVPPGSYTVYNQPPSGYGIGDAGTFPVTVSSGGTVTQDLLVTAAVYWDNMSTYTLSSQLTNTAGPIPSGCFWYHNSSTYQILFVSQGRTGGAITLDTTGGISGGNAMKMHVPTYNGGVSSSNPIGIGVRIFPALTVSNFYVRWTDYYTSTFQNGGSGAVGSQREYKALLVDIGSGAGGLGHIGLYVEGSAGVAQSYKIDSTDRLGHDVNTSGTIVTNPMPAFATWNTHVLCMENCGSSNYRLALYINGTLIREFTGQSFFPAAGGSVAGATQVQFSEQLNNGPDQDWDRFWAETGVYTTRPSLLPLVP